jgi:3-oxoadipate enol-lactonase
MRVTANGADFEVMLAGAESRPALFLAHSLATSHEMWALQVPLLARHFRVVAPDMRGHGASAAPGGDYTMDQLAEDVVAIADRLGIQHFHFCGLSIGGMIGQALGLNHGARLGRLVLASTFTGPMGLEAKAGLDGRIAAAASQGMPSQIEPSMGRWLSAEFRAAAPRQAQWIADQIAATPVAGFNGCAAAIREMKLEPAGLTAIKVPTLVIAGEKDPGATPAAGRRIAEAIPGARMQVIPGGYHLSNVEFPHVFTEMVLDFLLAPKNG